MKKEEYYEAYYLKTLDQEERRAFEDKLASDETFRQDYDAFVNLMIGIEAYNLKKDLEGVHASLIREEEETEYKKKPERLTLERRLWPKLVIAASILFCVAIGAYYLIGTPSSPEELFTAYYQTDPGLPTPMGQSDDIVFLQGMVAFKSADYEKARTTWQGLEENGTVSDSLTFYLGATYLEMDQPVNAIPYFQSIDETSEFYDKASWHLMMSYLATGQKENALHLSEDIIERKSGYRRDDAKKISNELIRAE